MTYDLVVKNALIVDGTGNKPYSGDVAVKDGRIAAVGAVDVADLEVRAEGVERRG